MSNTIDTETEEEFDSSEATRNSAGTKKRRSSPLRWFRSVIAELRKVVWPTRQEVVKYSVVVLFALVLMMAIILLLDNLFGAFAIFLFK